MDEKTQLNVYVTEETRALLESIKLAEGIPYTKQVELALQKWAAEKVPPPQKGRRR